MTGSSLNEVASAEAQQNLAASSKKKATSTPGLRISLLFALASMLAFVAYLEWGTGLATDDYVHLFQSLNWRLSEHLLPKEYLSVPLLHYTHGLAFFFIGDRPWAYDILKTVYLVFGVYFSFRFFENFCRSRRALLLAFLFVFLPLHDAANYSLTELYLVISFTCYLYAYALGSNENFARSVLFALLGSFSSYGSTPIAIGLTFLAFVQGQRKLSLSLLIPNLIYTAYYLITSLVLKLGTPRFIGESGIVPLAKQIAIQVVTFIDAAFGPSAWAKVFYSIASIDVLGCLIALAIAAASLFYVASEPRVRAPVSLLAAAAVIVVGSFGIFALTGLYPQVTFSLGDRVMIYGSFLLVCLFATLPVPRYVEAIVVGALIFAVVGISDHWKRWDREVAQVETNTCSNKEIRSLPPNTLLYVSGHQYSRLGPFSHIDFFTADYVVRTFFEFRCGLHIPVASFNRRLVLESGRLLDRKFSFTKPVANGGIWLYDSNRNIVERVGIDDIQRRIDALPPENRHWIQMLPEGWIKRLIRKAIPRLSYAF